MIRTVIVDDEPLARRRIAGLLESEADIEVIAECRNGREAVEAVRTERPDLLFLDIQMPGMDGFGVIEELEIEEIPVVVFATAYDEYALRAFEVHALDYLLKPYDRERFGEALRRARRLLADSAELEELRERIAGASTDGAVQRFHVKTGGSVTVVDARDIDWVEAAGNYAVLHEGRKRHFYRETMSEMEKLLPGDDFMRIHRSTIVRIDRVRQFKPGSGGGYVLRLQDGTELKASRGYGQSIREHLGRG